MIIDEYFTFRKEILDQSKDEEGFIEESLFLSQVLPSMLDAKLIDSEDYNNSYFISKADRLKINGYCVNESGERLQLFLVSELSIDLSAKEDDLKVSTKAVYEGQFKRGTSFVNKAIKGHLNDEIQDSSPARALISQISSSNGADQFDVVEVFLITATATVSLQGATPQPKRLEFKDEEINIKYTKLREQVSKSILVKKRLIDLNFLYNVLISQGNREALSVNFEDLFGDSICVIKAADEEHFESYLGVLPAQYLSTLYKQYSTRLLEKNVRSFLQFRGVNKGIRETIRKEPEKFIAYNNGLTITATSAEISKDPCYLKIKSLTDFQIVNGGQTTATIYFSQKDGFDISNVKVMAKINVAKNTTDEELEELISNISNFSNAQSRVSKVDLRSRNPQLVKIKSLSESVLTPSGKKWFFERAKGEYNTKLRIAGSNKNRLKKEFPNERKFSKEQMAKYSSAWGDKPFMVKKGGEKIFRYFIEELSGEDSSKKAIIVNRNYYEELISKILIFRRLEKLYGQGKNSMGQLRSAVVPYAISVLYIYTTGFKNSKPFDLLKIWLNEGLEEDLEVFFNDLLLLVNELIKKYSKSDDFGEFSKKEELWDSISRSKEISSFMGTSNADAILSKYTISKEELRKRLKDKGEILEVDFKIINDNVLIHTNGEDYYKKLINSLNGEISNINKRVVNNIVTGILRKMDFDEEQIKTEKKIINNIRINKPEVFDKLSFKPNLSLDEALDFIIKKYNKIIDSGGDIESEFDRISKIFEIKKYKYASVFLEIGKALSYGNPPTIKQLYYASNSFDKDVDKNETVNISIDDIRLTELLMRKMVLWDSNVKVLTLKQRNYVADFAYGLKKINAFHRKNIMNYLKKLRSEGFN